MAGVIMVVLGLLAAEDLKYKAVTVWKLVLFGLVCTIQAVRTGILRQSIEADTFVYGQNSWEQRTVLLYCFWGLWAELSVYWAYFLRLYC